MKIELRHQINCTGPQFWKTYLDPDFTRRLHTEALGSTSFELLSQEGTVRKGIHRTLRYGQKPEGPGPVMKLFGNEVITTETGTFDPASGTWTFHLVPGTLGDKTDVRGSIRLEPHGKTCEQVFTLEAKVRILGVGSIVERFIERQARDTQDRAVAFLNTVMASNTKTAG
jgi:hypothetical protein